MTCKVSNKLYRKKIKKDELKSLYRVGKIANNTNGLIIIKLNDVASKHRLLKLRNLKVMNNERETNAYFNPDRTILELESFRILEKEVKQRQAIADKKNLNVKY